MAPSSEPPKPQESHSRSRFNIRMMWRMNYLSILIFVAAVIYYIIKHS
ncbi:MAG: hypothetical protein KF690_09960 [Bacteroidetes bacterium]|nr:hypothetical protein [Bacteroidota bacterium]